MSTSTEDIFSRASWIRLPSGTVDNHTGTVPQNLHTLFRRTFTLDRMPVRAGLTISADDFAMLYINGRLAWGGPAPGYLHRYYYLEIDLLPYLQSGLNSLAVHNYYQGLINRVWNSGDGFYGIIANLQLTWENGDSEQIATDRRWHCLRCDAYHGHRMFGYETQFAEDIDQRQIPAGWRLPQFDDRQWPWAECVERDRYPHQMVLQETPPLNFHEVKPISCRQVAPSSWLYDFGKEVVGSAQIKVNAPSGTAIEIRHAEELDSDGRARYRMRANCEYQENCILDGSGNPLEFFDYKGFRYLELLGLPDPGHDAVTVLQRHYPIDIEASLLESSDDRLNRIWEICRHAVVIGTQDSYLDCPTREKGAYLGDAVVTGLAHLYISGDPRILKKVLADFAASMVYCSGIKAVAPGAFMQDIADYSLLWVPLLREYYRWTGDRDFVREMFPCIVDLLDFFAVAEGRDGLLVNFTAKPVMVDWPQNLRDNYDDPGLMGSHTQQEGINTVLNLYYVLTLEASLDLTSVVSDTALSKKLKEKSARLRQGIKRHLCRNGLLIDTDTSKHSALHPNALALFCELKPDQGWDAIIALIREKRLHCGVFFSFFQLQGLYNVEESDLAYELMTCDDERSWMTMVNAGATTCMEAWGPDQKWNTSWCHPWAAAPIIMIAAGLFGLRPAEPGWKKIAFHPQIPSGLAHASIRLTIPQGRISVAFVQNGSAIDFTVDLPEGLEMSCQFQEKFQTVTVNGKQVRG